MLSLNPVLVVFATLAAQALAATLQVLAIQDLSLDNTFVFKPNSLTANVGDMLEFHFAPTGFIESNHSVAQGTFDAGCEPMDNGFYSGNLTAPPDTELGEADQVFRVRVTSTDPMVFYCTAGQHCTRGMYGVVNPSDSQNLETYKATIKSYGPAVEPASVGGGEFAQNPGAATPAPAAGDASFLAVSGLGVAYAVALALWLA